MSPLLQSTIKLTSEFGERAFRTLVPPSMLNHAIRRVWNNHPHIVLNHLMKRPPLLQPINIALPSKADPVTAQWAAVRYDIAKRILLDSRFISSPEKTRRADLCAVNEKSDNALQKMFSHFMVFSEGQPHSDARFTAAALMKQPRCPHSPRNTGEAQSLNEIFMELESRRGKTLSLRNDISIPYPLRSVLYMLGISTSGVGSFCRWSHMLADAIHQGCKEQDWTGEAAQMLDFITQQIHERNQQPKHDGLTAILHAWKSRPTHASLEEHTSFRILAIHVANIILGGFETTAGAIRSGIIELAYNKQAWQKLKSNPDRYGQLAAKEILRKFSPVYVLGRYAASKIENSDLVSNGSCINEGDLVLILIGAANHDSDKFIHPFRFDMDRKWDFEPLWAGKGIHECIGKKSGESQIANFFSELAKRFDKIKILTPRRKIAMSPYPEFRSPEDAEIVLY